MYLQLQAISKIWLNGITDMIVSAHIQHTNTWTKLHSVAG